MEKTFEVTREDNCVWIRDLRVPTEGQPTNTGVTHVVPEQAQELIEKLQAVL